MGPRVPFAPALLTLSLHITLYIYFIFSRLYILLYVTCIMVNKAVFKKKKVSASQRKSKQVHARPGQTESQVDPGFQLASTCDSVWPGLNFSAAMFVLLRRAQTWRLDTKLYDFARMKNRRDLILGEVGYISIIYRIPDS